MNEDPIIYIDNQNQWIAWGVNKDNRIVVKIEPTKAQAEKEWRIATGNLKPITGEAA